MAPHFYGPGVFFFNDTATTEIYTLSLHDALPIYAVRFDAHAACHAPSPHGYGERVLARLDIRNGEVRSEEHTSELQSQSNLVCRLLLEKKKQWKTAVFMRLNPGIHHQMRTRRDRT